MIHAIDYKNKGFTLIEIMVVISIIASLASVILVGVRAAQASGRDSVRNSNALQVRNALALYANDHGGVPAGAQNVAGCTPQIISGTTSFVCRGITNANGVPDLGLGVLKPLVDGGYISHIPVDMINTSGLEYTYVTAPSTGVTPGANDTTVAITPTASFDYVSELKSLNPLDNPTVITIPIGDANYSSYSGDGYPGETFVTAPTISSFTGPGTLTTVTGGTWVVTVSNPNADSLTYSIDWGDTTTGTQNTITTPVTFTHTYSAAGTYNVTATVTGNGGSAQTQTLGVTVTVADPVPMVFSSSSGGIIPNGRYNVYQLNVSGLSGVVSNMTVDVKINGGINGDLEAILFSPDQVQQVIFGAWSYPASLRQRLFGVDHGDVLKMLDNIAGFDVTLADTAQVNIQNSPLISPVTGTYHPVDDLSIFNGKSPNGIWFLWIRDWASGGPEGNLESWKLHITTTGN